MTDTLLLTVQEAADRLNLGRSLTYRLLLAGDLRSVTIGRARRVPVGAIEEFIQSRLDAVDNSPTVLG